MSTPAGTMAPFAGLKEGVPEGWLLCDGSEVSPGSYPELYAAIGTNWGGDGSSVFNLPDLRGRFLRGADFDRAGETRDAVDPDRASRIALYSGGSTGALAGSYQGDAYQYHTHYLESWAGYNSNGYANSRNSGYGSGGPHGENIPTRRSDGDYSTETRPENAYVNYIIKY
ncbi:MAG: hypothetical protein GY754_20285 [bacterium]|nr:hypothetical protein [bacterium]